MRKKNTREIGRSRLQRWKSWPRHTAKTLENGANFYPIKSIILKEYTNQRMRFALGPRVSRVLCNIQHGFPFREFRGLLRSQCHRCFSLCIYYIVVSVSALPVDIYSNRVSIACFTVYWAVLFNIVLFARVACTQDMFAAILLICHCIRILEEYTSTNVLSLPIIKNFQGFQSWRYLVHNRPYYCSRAIQNVVW